jgi:hypothetical protein
MEWEWTRNEPGMTQENLMKILKFSNSGSFLGFLGILRIPEDSTRNWWGRVKTSKIVQNSPKICEVVQSFLVMDIGTREY